MAVNRGSFIYPLVSLLLLASGPKNLDAFRFKVDRHECVRQQIDEENVMVYVSFVVVSSDMSWATNFETATVDFTIEAPAGYHVHNAHRTTEEEVDFMAIRRGEYKFCFVNHGSQHETIAMEIQVGKKTPSRDELAKDEHFAPLHWKISMLEGYAENLLHSSKFHVAQADRQTQLARSTNSRLIVKTVLQSMAMVSVSIFQVVLLRKLFEKRLGKTSKV